MTTLTFNCGQSMNSSPTISLNIWQKIKTNPASHMVALATGLAIALILILIICGCKWWINHRVSSPGRTTPVPYLPVLGPSLDMTRLPTQMKIENQFRPQPYARTPGTPERYLSSPYPLNNLPRRLDTY